LAAILVSSAATAAAFGFAGEIFGSFLATLLGLALELFLLSIPAYVAVRFFD